MSFSSNAFANIGKVLGSSSSAITSSIDIPRKTNLDSSRLNESISNSLNNSPDDCSIVSDTHYVEFNNQQYKFAVLLCSDTNIQIKVVNQNTMDEYMNYIEKSFLDDKKYIRSIKILYKIIIDAITFSNVSIAKLTFKLVSDDKIQFNIIYNTHYDRYTIPLIIPLQKKNSQEKQEIIMKQLLNDNIVLKKYIEKLSNQISTLNIRINELSSKINNQL